MQTLLPVIICCFLAVIILFCFISFLVPWGLWIQAKTCGLNVEIFNLLAMRIRKVDARVIVENAIKLKKSGIDLSLSNLEAHYLAGGNIDNVVNALIMAKRAGINIDFMKMTAVDLSGHDPVEFINDIIQPKEYESDEFICKKTNGDQYKVSFKATSQLSREKPRALGSDYIIFDIKKYIEDYIYNLDSSKDVDAIALRNDILGTDFETGHGFIVHDIKVYTQRA